MDDPSSLFDCEKGSRIREIVKYEECREGDQDGGNALEDKTTVINHRSNGEEDIRLRIKPVHLHPSPSL
jgi:hypothetical protein